MQVEKTPQIQVNNFSQLNSDQILIRMYVKGAIYDIMDKFLLQCGEMSDPTELDKALERITDKLLKIVNELYNKETTICAYVMNNNEGIYTIISQILAENHDFQLMRQQLDKIATQDRKDEASETHLIKHASHQKRDTQKKHLKQNRIDTPSQTASNNASSPQPNFNPGIPLPDYIRKELEEIIKAFEAQCKDQKDPYQIEKACEKFLSDILALAIQCGSSLLASPSSSLKGSQEDSSFNMTSFNALEHSKRKRRKEHKKQLTIHKYNLKARAPVNFSHKHHTKQDVRDSKYCVTSEFSRYHHHAGVSEEKA